MCNICGQPNYIRCSCASSQPFCDQCAEDSVCTEVIDSSCVIYHFGNTQLPSRLINLGLPNGSSAQTIFEAIDAEFGKIGGGPITVTDTNAIHVTQDGPGGRHLTPFLILSDQSGNTAIINEDGLYVPLPDNLYKVQVDGSHIPYYLEDALIGGTDGIVSLSFEPSNGILFGLPTINVLALVETIVNDPTLIDLISTGVVNDIINNPTLITTLTNSVVNTILNNPTFLTALTTAIENAILNDSNFITALTQTIINNPAAKGFLCAAFKDCDSSGSTDCVAPVVTSATSIVSPTGGTAVLTINYTDASPIPNGYEVFYRKAGTTDIYATAGPFPPSSSPIVIGGIPVQDYEGYVESDCGGGDFSSGSTFVTSNAPVDFTVLVRNDAFDMVITNVTGIDAFTLPHDVPEGSQVTGTHTGSDTKTITVSGTAVGTVSYTLQIFVNEIPYIGACFQDAGGIANWSHSFPGIFYRATDVIRVSLTGGEHC